MSSVPVSEERLREYLVGQLQRNPQYHSAEIIGRRAALVGSKSERAETPRAPQSSDERQELRTQLEQIRSECFAAAPEELLRRLDRLNLGDHPDLVRLAARLRTIIESRGGLDALRGHRQFNADFLACLQQVLISPPREVNVLREQVIVAFRRRRERRRGKGMIKLVKHELPALYALEREWLETLTHYKPNDALGKTSGETDWFSGTKATVVFIVVIGFIVVGALTEEEDDKRSGNRRRVFNGRQESRVPMAIESVESVPSPSDDVAPPIDMEEPAKLRGDRTGELTEEELKWRTTELVNEYIRQRRAREARAQGAAGEPGNDTPGVPPNDGSVEDDESDDDDVMAPFATPRYAPAPQRVPGPSDLPR